MDTIKTTNKNTNTVKAAPFGPAVLFVNVFDEERNELVTTLFKGYGFWEEAVRAGREALRDAVMDYHGFDAKALSNDPEDCTSEVFQDYDTTRQLLTLWVEDEPGEVIAEAVVLSTPEFPQVRW